MRVWRARDVIKIQNWSLELMRFCLKTPGTQHMQDAIKPLCCDKRAARRV